MEKKQPIIVRVNQDQYKKAVTKKLIMKHPMVEKESNEIDYPMLSSGGSHTSSKHLPIFVKVILFVVAPAAAIGLLLGFTMLHLFSDMNTGSPAQQAATSGPTSGSSKSPVEGVQIRDKQDSSTFTIPMLDTFVLQGGIFSESANAQEIKDNFTSAGNPAVIAQVDGQYYLFAGISASGEEAKSMAQEMKKQELDVYAKEWHVKEKKINMTTSESQWITSFSKTFQTALNDLSDHEKIDQSQWAALQKKLPEKSNIIDGLGAVVSALAKNDQDINYQQQLLDGLKAYEEMGNN